MNSPFQDSSQRTLLIDANLLLLLFVGAWDPSGVERHKNTANLFTAKDLDLLRLIVSQFGTVATTTHVLTEVSNLSAQHGDPDREALFRRLVEVIPPLPEHTESAKTVVDDPAFVRLGLTDVALSRIAEANSFHVITTDAALWAHLLKMGVVAYNFNHARSWRLLESGSV